MNNSSGNMKMIKPGKNFPEDAFLRALSMDSIYSFNRRKLLFSNQNYSDKTTSKFKILNLLRRIFTKKKKCAKIIDEDWDKCTTIPSSFMTSSFSDRLATSKSLDNQSIRHCNNECKKLFKKDETLNFSRINEGDEKITQPLLYNHESTEALSKYYQTKTDRKIKRQMIPAIENPSGNHFSAYETGAQYISENAPSQPHKSILHNLQLSRKNIDNESNRTKDVVKEMTPICEVNELIKVDSKVVGSDNKHKSLSVPPINMHSKSIITNIEIPKISHSSKSVQVDEQKLIEKDTQKSQPQLNKLTLPHLNKKVRRSYLNLIRTESEMLEPLIEEHLKILKTHKLSGSTAKVSAPFTNSYFDNRRDTVTTFRRKQYVSRLLDHTSAIKNDLSPNCFSPFQNKATFIKSSNILRSDSFQSESDYSLNYSLKPSEAVSAFKDSKDTNSYLESNDRCSSLCDKDSDDIKHKIDSYGSDDDEDEDEDEDYDERNDYYKDYCNQQTSKSTIKFRARNRKTNCSNIKNITVYFGADERNGKLSRSPSKHSIKSFKSKEYFNAIPKFKSSYSQPVFRKPLMKQNKPLSNYQSSTSSDIGYHNFSSRISNFNNRTRTLPPNLRRSQINEQTKPFYEVCDIDLPMEEVDKEVKSHFEAKSNKLKTIILWQDYVDALINCDTRKQEQQSNSFINDDNNSFYSKNPELTNPTTKFTSSINLMKYRLSQTSFNKQQNSLLDIFDVFFDTATLN